MRHTEETVDLGNEERSQEVHGENSRRRRETLFLLLNIREGEHPGLGAPIFPEMHDRITASVVAVKKVVDSLALAGPMSNPKAMNEAIESVLALREINEVLADVRLRPEVVLSADMRTLTSRVTLWFDPETRFRSPQENGWKLYPDAKLTQIEQQAFLALSELLKDGRIDDLRRCACGTWFLAVRSDQKCCSAVCRQRKHARGKQFNKSRRERYATKKLLEAARQKKGTSHVKKFK